MLMVNWPILAVRIYGEEPPSLALSKRIINRIINKNARPNAYCVSQCS